MISPRAAHRSVYVLYGALRSGSTLMRLILDAHPAIRCSGERDFMLDHIRTGVDGPRLDLEELGVDRVFLASGLAIPESIDGREAFLDLLGQQEDDESVLVLVLHRGIELLLSLVPDARIIHLLRDPRDVARSSLGMGWAGSTWYGIDHWIKTETEWDRVAHQLKPEQVLTVRYEELMAAPETGLETLCTFLGCTYDPAMLDFHQTTTYSAIDPTLCYQWKRKQTRREITLVEQKTGRLLTARGYAPSGHPMQPPDPVEGLWLWGSNKIAVWRMLFNRYGYVDPVLARLGRRFGLMQLARSAQLRMNIKQNRTLKK